MEASLGILKVFISAGCLGCKRALELVTWLRRVKPQLGVEVVDIALKPDAVGGYSIFAIPTYVYNNKAVFLGNPSRKELQLWMDRLQPEA